MSKYQDKLGGWNARAKEDQNLFTYGMYADLLGLDTSKYQDIFNACKVRVDRDWIEVNRRPNLEKPPISTEEFIGILYFKFISYDIAKKNEFTFWKHGEPLDERVFEKIFKAILELVFAHNINIFMSGKAKVKQRNLIWERNLTNANYFAFRLTPAHTYVVKKYFGKKFHDYEEKMFVFYRDNVLKDKSNLTGSLSQKNLMWAMLNMIGDFKRAKKMKPWIYFSKYFGKDHPFTKAIRKKYGV